MEAKDVNYLKEILTSNIYDVASVTALEKASFLSDTFDNNILLKREDKQIGHSFKIRGVYNKIKKILKTNKNIICASNGNHAYAVAYVCHKFDCKSIAVLPKIILQNKVASIEKLGTNVILYGDTFEEAQEYAKKYADEHKFVYIDPFDDVDIIAGNGTIGMELVNQLGSDIENIHAIFVPIGGGGLISGIAVYIKELYPSVKIIGVGIENSCAMDDALKNNSVTCLDKVTTFAESTSVKKVCLNTFNICKKYVDEIILISVDEICTAIKYIHEDTKTIVEPACAMSIAGLCKYIDKYNIVKKNLIAIMSGGVVSFEKLKFITERANIGNKSEANIKITIPEKPNSLLTLLKHIDDQCTSDVMNITQFHYRANNKENASIIVGFTISGDIGTKYIIDSIGMKYKVDEFSHTMISSYIPFLIGGSVNKLASEYIFTITLPERPGALMELLTITKNLINITMFHYNNIGDIRGNILMGIQLRGIEYANFILLLNKINMITYNDETTFFNKLICMPSI
ncbi:MAG: L-threonine dehydratase biosynthetic IlvA [Edafosvirus sp.]|uniref:threonine ammonia-lyase n=1 Tax=Edafosvirus sp. TaxID=2487765 RepID=A0A3G4ZXC3_9VIRU|nr:MAG: L-threonine dehydratase biosynthetic IlvA [Edafosvirus sp.]